MTLLNVKQRDGGELRLDAIDGCTLMETLRDGGCKVDGICGGELSCGTCHVYVADTWIDRLPPRSADEQAMLEAIGELVELRAGSRLSCQIRIAPEHAGMAVEIGPVP